MNFPLKNHGCELFYLIGMVGKVELLSTFATAVCECWNVSEKYSWVMVGILNNYPWTRLAIRIIGTISRQVFLMVAPVFDNRNLSQETFAIDTWRAVLYSLGHDCKHMLSVFLTIWRPGLREVSVSSCSRADNHAVIMAVDLVKLRVSWHFLEK